MRATSALVCSQATIPVGQSITPWIVPMSRCRPAVVQVFVAADEPSPVLWPPKIRRLRKEPVGSHDPRGRVHRGKVRLVDRPIVAFRQNEARTWVAEVACGHSQHIRTTLRFGSLRECSTTTNATLASAPTVSVAYASSPALVTR